MTKKVAIEWLKSLNYCDGEETQEVAQAINMAIKALEKDIPKAPKKSEYEYYDWYCPTCNKFLAYECDTKHKYIHHCECGQRLDWGNAPYKNESENK